MQTFRNKFYIVCDEEVIANSEAESKLIAKKQLEEKLYKTDINFVDVAFSIKFIQYACSLFFIYFCNTSVKNSFY